MCIHLKEIRDDAKFTIGIEKITAAQLSMNMKRNYVTNTL